MTRKSAHDKEMQLELDALQSQLKAEWLDKSLPEDWDGIYSIERLDRKKTRVTIRLDADMVRWFRKLGPNYSRRINSILRIYWLALLSGHIQAHHRDKTLPRLMLAAHYLARDEEDLAKGLY